MMSPQQPAPIGADAVHRMKCELDRIAQRRERWQIGHPLARAQQLGGQVDQILVHQTFADEGAVELVAGFDMQLVDLAPGQIADPVQERFREHLLSTCQECSLSLGIPEEEFDPLRTCRVQLEKK